MYFHSEMITTLKAIYTSSTHIVNIVMGARHTYTLSKFPVFSSVLLAIDIMAYVESQNVCCT